MFKAGKLLNLLLIILLISIVAPVNAEPEVVVVEIETPVWDDLDDSETGDLDDPAVDDGFVEPPPREKIVSVATDDKIENTEATSNKPALEAVIMPSTPQVQSGEVIIFKAVANQANLRYYWKSGEQSSIEPDFTFNTADLPPGKYRVLLTVTNRERVQAHTYTHISIIVINPASVVSTPVSKDESTTTTKPVSTAPLAIPPVIAPVIPTETTDEKTDSLVEVPDLSNKSMTEAHRELREIKLSIGAIEERAAAGKPGLIIEQLPPAGEQVLEGATIDLVVSVKAAIAMPDLIGMPEEQAKIILDRRGLTLEKIITRADDKNHLGLVVEQSPQALSTVEEHTTVTLVVGKQASFEPKLAISVSKKRVEQNEPLSLFVRLNPKYSGELKYEWKLGPYHTNKAKFKIKRLGLKSGKYTAHLKVSNEQGQAVTAIQQITVVKASPLMPNVLGLSEQDARAKLAFLKANKLLVSVEEAKVTKPEIIRQHPAEGQKIDPSVVVRLILVKPMAEKHQLTLSLDNNSPVKGDTVKLTAQLEPMPTTKNIHYMFHLNGEQKAQLEPEYSWLASQSGDYELSVSAYSDEGLIKKSLPLQLKVAEPWDKPVAMIVPTTQTVVQGEKVEFSSTSTYDIKSTLIYQWSNDVGGRSELKKFVIDSQQVAPGEYAVKLSVTDDRQNMATTSATLIVKAVTLTGRSDKETKEEATLAPPKVAPNNPSQNQAKKTSLHIESSRKFANTGEVISFKLLGLPVSDQDKVKYFYNFDDNSVMKWSDSAQVSHTFAEFGTYQVRGGAKINGEIYRTPTVSVWVWSSGLLYFVFGIAGLLFLLMWGWTKYIPKDKDALKEQPILAEEQVPLPLSANKASTRQVDNKSGFISRLLKGFIQLILGVAISAIAIYFILERLGLS
ncbi:MAG: PASTA domain-containing protein [Thiotrichaceae bacterium]|nr:PASTA domain-containing protein [Thiotrichaceae bacterium]